jgi:hypothetical protein
MRMIALIVVEKQYNVEKTRSLLISAGRDAD